MLLSFALTFSLLILGVWVLAGLALGLHLLSLRYGAALMLMYVAVLAGMLTYADPISAMLKPLPRLVLTIPSDMFVAVILLAVLLLYIFNGTETTQLIIFGIALIQLLVGLVFAMVSLSAWLPLANGQAALTDALTIDIRRMLAGIVAFVVDMLAITILYQGGVNRYPQAQGWVASGALVGALLTDALVFNLLAELGRGGFWVFLPGDVVSKLILGLVMIPLVVGYLRATPHSLNRYPAQRATFDILHNMFGRWQGLLAQLEAELHESEVNSYGLMTHIHEIFWIADAKTGSAHFISPAFDAITGVARGQVYLGTGAVERLLHPEDAAQVRGEWLHYAPQQRELLFRIERPDGQTRWLRDRTYPVTDDELGIQRVIGITEDVTDSKNAAALVSAIAAEKQKIKLLDDLTQELAHDLKSPLTALQLKLDLLERMQEKPEHRQRYLEELRGQTHHLTDLIRHAFTLLRVKRSGENDFELHAPQMLVAAIGEELRPTAEAKNLTLTLDMPSEVDAILCDSVVLRRALTNLLTNAIRYTPQGGTITVSLSQQGGEARLMVRDTGIGIPPDELDQVFERFYRGNNAVQIEGTGLGLAITREIVQAHGGRISVTSEVNVGTTFTVWLPCYQGE